MKIKLLALLTLLCTCSAVVFPRDPAFDQYIQQHLKLAQKNRAEYGIPISITLSQALLESNAGRSDLARKANNHFGVKVKTDWTGPYVLKTDDAPNEKFCKYRNVEHSYNHHGEFLKRPYYSELFQIDTKDYKGWARGLQRAGYATNPQYATTLIRLIEQYQLDEYDNGKSMAEKKIKKKGPQLRYDIYKNNEVLYIEAKEGDSFRSIGTELGESPTRLAKYNELPADTPLKDGDVVYLQRKKRRASPKNYTHQVKGGESMHSIAQKYAIRLNNLCKMNKKKGDYSIEQGDILILQ